MLQRTLLPAGTREGGLDRPACPLRRSDPPYRGSPEGSLPFARMRFSLPYGKENLSSHSALLVREGCPRAPPSPSGTTKECADERLHPTDGARRMQPDCPRAAARRHDGAHGACAPAHRRVAPRAREGALDGTELPSAYGANQLAPENRSNIQIIPYGSQFSRSGENPITDQGSRGRAMVPKTPKAEPSLSRANSRRAASRCPCESSRLATARNSPSAKLNSLRALSIGEPVMRPTPATAHPPPPRPEHQPPQPA
ncbi:MAG: hypothetical protein [Cressdnaviricota sp.]|nr:MAG: hypothetical protein [Cressdnaviricota sp.]